LFPTAVLAVFETFLSPAASEVGMVLTVREREVLRRRSRGGTQVAVARALGISQAAVSDFERSAHAKILGAHVLLASLVGSGVGILRTPAGLRVAYTERSAPRSRRSKGI
jgi:DNA-binding CsgD family transcriptional regulator